MMPLASGTWNHHSNMKKKAAMTPTEMASAFRKPVSVSYTHLTLPTICSV